jgi:hypothetical protein
MFARQAAQRKALRSIAFGAGNKVPFQTRPFSTSFDPDKDLIFYENLGPRKNKGMLLSSAWSLLTTCTFCYFEYIHVPAPADATMFVKIISSETWNFAGILLGPIISFGNYKYGNYLVSEMAKSGDTVSVRTHTFLGFPSRAVHTHEVGDFVFEGFGNTNDLLQYRIANTKQRYIFNREPHVEELLGPKQATEHHQQQHHARSGANKRGGGLRRVKD